MKDTTYKITAFCSVKNNTISYNGNIVFKEAGNVSDFLKAAYKNLEIKYPKFFKMDALSKLAFIAAEVLLKQQGVHPEDEANIALVFSNRASSLETDRVHQESIQNKQNYYPSPAVFVYTLPNICLGEISIKYKLYSENSFFIFDNFNEQHLYNYSNMLLHDNLAEQVLCGWVDVDGDDYEAFLYLVSPEGSIAHEPKEIKFLYNT